MKVSLIGLQVPVFASTSALAQSVTPFTLIEISRQFDAAGNVKAESEFLFAVNRDGSVVSVNLDPSAGRARQIIDVKRRETTVVNPAGRAASTGAYGARRETGEACHKRFLSFQDAVVSVDASAGVIHGVSVQRVSVDWPNGHGMDVFMAPSLACQMLRTVTRRDGRSLETLATRDLRIGDPDPQLFEVPVDYRRTRTN
jgi:hypothetical protein